MLISNSTVSSNSAANNIGGLSINRGTTRLNNVTISNNQVFSGKNIANLANYATVKLRNTIIANPIGSGTMLNCASIGTPTWISEGNNMADDDSCGLETASGDFPNTDPMLTPLFYLGGPTLTHGLLSGSPAHDAKTNFCLEFSGSTVSTDQRGSIRDNKCDIGAFEGVATIFYSFLPSILK